MANESASLWQAIEELHHASFAWARACVGTESEAEDVLQTVYEKIAGGRARFDGRASVKTWLFGVIRWTASEHRRRRWLSAIVPARTSVVPTPEQRTQESETARVLLDAMRDLPERQRQVVHLVFYEDLTVEAAAEAMGISVGSARTHYDRAKKKLRERLSHTEEGIAR
jgi:RNA polymerase sigma-70 factor (ECF subfamily)